MGVEMTRFRNIANDASYPPFFRTYLALREITQNQCASRFGSAKRTLANGELKTSSSRANAVVVVIRATSTQCAPMWPFAFLQTYLLKPVRANTGSYLCAI